ncbi:membrane-associated tyrosine- and threonine-specific cdc2-inhibitory kinase-like isoform X2 [Apostichopus japonicus]|uniref:membrane-associated tyrosine- and threonine-specific cdc2-inhibitory kinase-like isoform X2 n=1 Tax=Stichopus japonicus TaxID=307972 RepID=UPI003AB709F2
MDGLCKLGDFGLTVSVKSGELINAREGDAKYLAPELLEGKYSKAADVFSLGMTILELATDWRFHNMEMDGINSEMVKYLGT